MKILAIDGNSIINRAFYGIKVLSTKDGKYTNAIYGFTNILLRLMDETKPDCVAVAWDIKKPTFRHDMYKEYKAGRHAMPEELKEQIPVMKEMLTLMGITCIEKEGYEADDILGTISAAAEESGNECVIATGDRDSLQLIGKHTNVMLSATKMGKPEITLYNREALKEKYGLTPAQMIELKALMGDSSDNIPGVAGIGEKTAAALITAYENIDKIYEDLDSLDIKDGVRAKLTAGRDSAFLSRTLGTICRTVPISRDLEEYKIKPRDDRRLSLLMTSLELYKLMERMNINPQSFTPENNSLARKFEYKEPDKFTLSKQIDIYNDQNSLSLCSGNTVTVMPISDCKGILENGDIKKRVYDFKALYKDCVNSEIKLSGVIFDATLAGYLYSPSASEYDLDRLYTESRADAIEYDGDGKNAALLSAVCDKLAEILDENGQMPLLNDIELPLAEVLGSMELEGFLVDRGGIEKYSVELESRIADIEKEIYSLVGYEFNLNSPKQLGVALFETLKLPAKKKTKSGYSTNAEVLESLRYAHPAVSLLLEYRQLAKLKSTYCDGLLKAIDADGRIHSTFNQTETRTGRISSTEPNLQNIPVRTEEGKKFRKFFTAKEGYSLCDADYSQIELRVLAHIANDKNMLDAFLSGTDIHTLTASQVFKMPIDMVTPVMRSRAKAVNFGIVYGIGAFSLGKDIGVSRAEADSYIKGYLATYPQVNEYMEKVIYNAKRDGFVTTVFGRRRYLPELSASNGMIRAFGERVARNAPIQGTAADIIKIAMIKVYRRLKDENIDAKLILQVHDELIVEAKDEYAQKVCDIITEEMENAVNLSVKLSVDASYGKTWFEAKK